MNKSKLLTLLVSITVLFSVTFLSNNKVNDYVIGINIDQNLNSNPYALEQVNSIKMAISDFNVSGGFDGSFVTLKTLNNKSDENQAKANQIEFAKDESVIGTISFSSIEAQKKIEMISNQNRLVNISMAIESIELQNDRSYDELYSFRTAFSEHFQGYLLANQIFEVDEISNAIVVETSKNNSALSTQFEERFEYLGGKSMSMKIDELIDNLLSTNGSVADKVILLPGNFYDYVNEVKAIREANESVNIYSALGPDIPDLKKDFSILKNTRLLDHYNPYNVSIFQENYFETHGDKPTKYGVLAYDSTILLLSSLVISNSSDETLLMKSLESTHMVDLVSGTISIDKYHNAFKGGYLRRFTEKCEMNPTYVSPNSY